MLGSISHLKTVPRPPHTFQMRRWRRGGFWGFPTHRIEAVRLDGKDRRIEPEGICSEYDIGRPFPASATVKSAVESVRADVFPYAQSMFADATDAMQATDVVIDAMITEVDTRPGFASQCRNIGIVTHVATLER